LLMIGVDMRAKRDPKIVSQVKQEFRHVSIIMAVLASLKKEQHGYPLRKSLSKHGFDIEEGALYPLLYRLEKKGLLNARWIDVGNRKRRLYLISDRGQVYLHLMLEEWKKTNSLVEKIL